LARKNELSLYDGLNKVRECDELASKAQSGLADLADIINSYRAQMEELAPAALIDGLIRRLDYLRFLSMVRPRAKPASKTCANF
jgi:hypothetical protein